MVNKRSIFVLGTAALFVYLFFPKVTGFVYRSTSDPIEIEEKKREYWELTEEKDSVIASEQNFIDRREELFLWLWVRYIEIDAGHISPTLLERWKMLFEYWKLESKE